MVLGGALGPGLGGRDAGGAASLLRGRRGTILHPRSFCVAGVAQTRMYRRFVPSFCVAGVALMVLGGALGPGLGGTPVAPLHFCVAGVAQSYIHGRFAWQAWHRLACTVVLYRRGFAWQAWRRWRRFTSAWQAWRKTSLACIRLNHNYNESVKWNWSFACKDAVLPACFFFPRASACLILACLSTFFFRPVACFGMFDFSMFKFGHLHAKRFWHV